MVQTLDSRDLIAVHRKLAACWEMSEISTRGIDMNSYKKRKTSNDSKNLYMDSQLGESTNQQMMKEAKSTGNFPRMTRNKSKSQFTVNSKDTDVIGNPMGAESHYNGSMKDNQSMNNEQAIRVQFTNSLLDAFVTKQEEYDQFKQNDEKQYQDGDYEDDDWSWPI